jgi:predicted nucleic acid-binding protein
VIVLDASAAVEFVLGTPSGEQVGARIARPGETLHAPHLIDIEVASVLRRWVRQGQLTAERGWQAVADLQDLMLVRYPHGVLLERIWELRSNASAYDAAYLALADVLDAPLVTCDRRIVGIPGHRAAVEPY